MLGLCYAPKRKPPLGGSVACGYLYATTLKVGSKPLSLSFALKKD